MMSLVDLSATIMAFVMFFVCAILAWNRFHNVFAVIVGAVGGVFIGFAMVILTVIIIILSIFVWAKLTGQTELFDDAKPEPEIETQTHISE